MGKLSKKEMRIKTLWNNIETYELICILLRIYLCWFVITLYILCLNFGILSILRTFNVISSPLSNSKGTSDTLFFLVECTSCNIPLILVSSLPWENPPYCLVLHTVAGKLYWWTADLFQLAAILTVPCLRMVIVLIFLRVIFQTIFATNQLLLQH